MQRAARPAELELRPDRETVAWLRDAGLELTAQTTIAKLMQRPNLDLDRLIAAAADTLPEFAGAFARAERGGAGRRRQPAALRRLHRAAAARGGEARRETKTCASRRR